MRPEKLVSVLPTTQLRASQTVAYQSGPWGLCETVLVSRRHIFATHSLHSLKRIAVCKGENLRTFWEMTVTEKYKCQLLRGSEIGT